MARKNCWEVMNCGRHPDDENVDKRGVCPAALPGKFDGVNGGFQGGRFCWAVSGTSCGQTTQGTYLQKLPRCIECKFLKQVTVEEGRFFILTLGQLKETSR